VPIYHLSVDDVLIIHSDQIDRYGGSYGIRDTGLLDSAVAVVRAEFGGELAHKDIFEMAAAYLFHIVKNHPFIDGNKRTGLASALIFLEMNGIDLDIDDEKLYKLVLGVIENKIKKSGIASFFRSTAKENK